jgi:hypothetical protein
MKPNEFKTIIEAISERDEMFSKMIKKNQEDLYSAIDDVMNAQIEVEEAKNDFI